ncbi:MAG: NPCBM/NEW2 domain-containing protein [Planctomycetota bacterium]|nr:NPCBM/NEW2 domain-containing protein [Planctomycetota bacterium]
MTRYSKTMLVACFVSALVQFATKQTSATEPIAPKRIVFIAGNPSHGYGDHEHFAGARILADVIQKTDPNAKCEVIRNGWPQDDSILDSADTIVIYSDGGGGHPALAHLDRLKKHMDRGAGFVCIHYAVEVPKDKGGPEFLSWLGGYFETDWSVNPHWDGKFDNLPKHPITSGVKPFQTRDEWYFHMRFPDGMKGVTPILSAVPPASTMDRPDGAHSGNPAVRKEVARGDLQHVAWATDRPNGGRSFGFTGGHFHWNWGRTEPTKLVANAILWTAHMPVPEAGATVEPKTVKQLQENQDDPVKPDFDLEKTAKTFQLISSNTSTPATTTKPANGKLLFSSQTVNNQTSRHQIDVDVDVTGVKKLYLVVTAGDNFAFDWADWVEPKLVGKQGEKSLLDLEWFEASTDYGKVAKNANVEGGPLQVRNQVVKGIGTHANSVIGFVLPEGYERFQVGCALDNGGVSRSPDATSVRFHIAAESVPEGLNNWGGSGAKTDNRSSDKAVAGLAVAKGLEASLAASEPILKSLTNIDIDHKGRIWVCEVVNYRKHKNDRVEGDRILILEDTNQDGIVDTSKVFYQGRDIDSALGLCVLGNRVIVSAAPYVWEFIDENGDDVPDSKRALLTKTGDPQHDHSVHSFLFGPDGKLYFNYGNTGHRLCDTDGNPIKDRWGREINDSGKPYRQGMVFRCNEDLSDMEVLGHNFRNNYEVSVDSFGTLWQSDNDDDGNRATRINYVMEFGNYGYTDEANGAGWQVERTNWEPEIPRRHWHLNDPGVVPNVLITGAGSPTGITVYEGSLLPEKFRNQMIHCDAGPNVVRSYIAKPDGAGYSATIEDIAVGEFDKWFRPADVCVAPDGSLFVSDWYDPGVGGHNMEDMERGRLFRIAPPGTKYTVPKFDLSTAAGAVEALRNPCNSVRFMAYQAIMKMKGNAANELSKLAADANPRMRARALWLLSKIGDTKQVVQQASKDADSDVRVTGVRIARQAKLATKDYMPQLLGDKSVAVLRELAVALREDKSSDMPEYWSKLAAKYDGIDRWYLESLGIAATDRWDDCLAAWKKANNGNLESKASQLVVWRARGSMAAQLQADALRNPKIADSEIPAMFRALDLQDPESRQKALRTLLDITGRDNIVVEALMRLDGVDVQSNPKLVQAVNRYLSQLKNDPSQLKIIQKLKVPGLGDRLVDLAAIWGENTQSVQALELAIEQGGLPALTQSLMAKAPDDRILMLSKVLTLSNKKPVQDLRLALINDENVSKVIKVDAVLGLSKSKGFHAQLIDLAKANKLPGESKILIGATLRSSDDAAIKKAADELFPPIKSSQNPLPPIEVLVKKNGNPNEGKKLYAGVATCSQCHQVGTEGKNVGPALTEIGSKLSKDAMYAAILAPSAGISHNYESFAARTDDDEVVIGLMVSDTPQSVTIKDAKGIEKTIKRENLAEIKKQEKSLMPENLQETMSEQGLVDLVEYLMSLKKP